MATKVTVGQIIASNYIKFDRLSQMVNTAFANSTAEKINLFIDVNSCIKQLYAGTVSLASLDEETSIAAYIINMIAHYRKFFKYRYSVECNAHLIYSTNIRPETQMFYQDYNKDAANMMRLMPEKTNLIVNNLEILDKICPYLPNTSFTMGTFETGVIMHDIISRVREENVPNIVISKDLYVTQLLGINPDVIIFRPKKHIEDQSFFISKGGSISNLIADRQVNDIPEELDDGLLSFIIALNKFPERSMKTLLALPKALSITKNAVRTGKILNGYNSNVSLIYQLFPDKEKIQCIHGNIDSRFKAIDLLYQYAIYSSSIERHNFKGMQNLYDPQSIHTICNEYFKVNPLDLDNL